MLGLLGAVIAFFLQWALYAAVARGVDSNDTLQLIQVMPFSAAPFLSMVIWIRLFLAASLK